MWEVIRVKEVAEAPEEVLEGILVTTAGWAWEDHMEGVVALRESETAE